MSSQTKKAKPATKSSTSKKSQPKRLRPNEELDPLGYAHSKYHEKHCAALIKHAKNPYGTFRSFAAKIGVDEETMLNWCDKHPEFKRAKAIAKQINENAMMEIGAKGIQGKISFFGQSAWIFWMKARHGWTEHGPNEQEDNDLDFEFERSDGRGNARDEEGEET